MKEYRKYRQLENQILDTGTQWLLDKDVIDWSKDTALVAVGEEPINWHDMAIENGKLVKASQEVIAERLRIKQVAQREAIRVAREARYNSEQISSLYWNWVESGNAADKAKWIEAKEQVRKELPYPNEKGGEK